MDLVVPLRQEAAGAHPELLYALRSIDSNLSDVGEVWILGGKPKWLTNANHIPLVQSSSKYTNVRRMLKHACLEPAISDPFVLSNDDIFALQPQNFNELELLHGGDFCEWIQRQQARLGRSRYVDGACKSIRLLEHHGYKASLAWSLHVPIVVHKAAFLEAIGMCGDSGIPYHLRSMYGAIQGLQGTRHVDVKLIGNAMPDRAWKYVSTADMSFQSRPVGQMLRKTFDQPSRWEIAK